VACIERLDALADCRAFHESKRLARLAGPEVMQSLIEMDPLAFRSAATARPWRVASFAPGASRDRLLEIWLTGSGRIGINN